MIAKVILPKGLIASLVTPLNEDGSLDAAGLRKLISAVSPVASGILIGDSLIGEGLFLGNIRESLIREAMSAIRGRQALIVGITGDSSRRSRENIKVVERLRDELAYTGGLILLDLPLWYHSNRGLLGNCRELTELTDLPFILSNNPHLIKGLKRHFKRPNIRTNILKGLCEIPQIVGLVHCGQFSRFLNYRHAARERETFLLYEGNELSFLNHPGKDGVVSAGVSLFPEEWGNVCERSLNLEEMDENDPNLQHLWRLREKLSAFYNLYNANPAAILKAALKQAGLINSSTVLKGKITPEETKRVEAFLSKGI